MSTECIYLVLYRHSANTRQRVSSCHAMALKKPVPYRFYYEYVLLEIIITIQ